VSGLKLQSVAIFALQVLMQLTAIVLLPPSKGFTKPFPTIGCSLAIVASVYLLARLVNSGTNLSTLIPMAATVVPLASMAMGILIYGETPSVVKVVLLGFACLIVAVAGRFN
jgi:multidrug transporter EmrE-like cation transporter